MPEPQGVPKVLPLKDAYKLLEANGFVAEAALLRNAFPGKSLPKRRAKRGMALAILRSKGLLDRFITEAWPYGTTPDGNKRIARYDKYYQESTNSSPEPASEEAEDSDEAADRFAFESDLRDYLAKNLGLLEPGMRLWDVAEGQTAIEFQVDDDGRRIDILAKDRNGVPVVIELKVSRGHERVIGQSLYYRERIKERFSLPTARVIIVAREISDELRVACRAMPDVELFEYRLSMTVRKVEAISRAATT